jgi:hypothetical protein
MKELTLKLIDYKYDEEKDLISWRVQDINEKKEVTLSWLSEDLSTQFGIDGKIPPDAILSFCEDMKNRPWPFTLQLISTAKHDDSKWVNEETSMKEIQDEHENVDRYPFYEVMKQIHEESNES